LYLARFYIHEAYCASQRADVTVCS
jgi:hypothetical protein